MKTRRERLLPGEMWWLYALGPLMTSVIINRSLIHAGWRQNLVDIGANYIPFFAVPGSFELAYRWLVPRWLARVRGRKARVATHLVIVVVVASLVSQLVFPLHRWALGEPTNRVEFGIICVVMSAAFLFPALLVQSLRNRARAAELLALEERQAALEAQLQALRARTNPHFFFNSVNTVASLIPDDPALAERTLERLADLFRYALDSSRIKAVPLAREIEMVRDYLAIQAARFGDRLSAEVTLDAAAAAIEVPPLLLQPLVENAIFHGLGHRKRGAVAVRARRTGDEVVIEVRDDGPGLGASSHRGTGTSVNDLGARIRLHYGQRGSFALEGAVDGGCVARLRLPVT